MSAGPAVHLTARPPNRLFHLVLEPHDGRALVPIPKRSASPWGHRHCTGGSPESAWPKPAD